MLTPRAHTKYTRVRTHTWLVRLVQATLQISLLVRRGAKLVPRGSLRLENPIAMPSPSKQVVIRVHLWVRQIIRASASCGQTEGFTTITSLVPAADTIKLKQSAKKPGRRQPQEVVTNIASNPLPSLQIPNLTYVCSCSTQAVQLFQDSLPGLGILLIVQKHMERLVRRRFHRQLRVGQAPGLRQLTDLQHPAKRRQWPLRGIQAERWLRGPHAAVHRAGVHGLQPQKRGRLALE